MAFHKHFYYLCTTLISVDKLFLEGFCTKNRGQRLCPSFRFLSLQNVFVFQPVRAKWPGFSLFEGSRRHPLIGLKVLVEHLLCDRILGVMRERHRIIRNCLMDC